MLSVEELNVVLCRITRAEEYCRVGEAWQPRLSVTHVPSLACSVFMKMLLGFDFHPQ